MDLEQLKKLIAEADKTVATTVANAGFRIKLCADIGRGLKHHRQLIGHGGWINWLAENFEGLTHETSRKWIKLAEAVDSGKLDLDSAKSIRQAYILAGILPDPDESGAGSSSAAPSYLVYLDRFETALRDIDVAKLPASDRQKLRERLKPLASLYAQLMSA